MYTCNARLAQQTHESLAPYRLSERVFMAIHARPYERQRDDPQFRPLRVFVLDPSLSKLYGSEDLLHVPYEPLTPGPEGALFCIDSYDASTNTRYPALDLQDPKTLIHAGLKPSASDPQFRQQMVYAVSMNVYESFRLALGRNLSWGFYARTPKKHNKLILKPNALECANAFYDREAGAVSFGYYQASADANGRNLPNATTFTCLSHDIIAHELTHALLDGLRSHLTIPSNPDVLAFHEAFADLVATLHHFKHETLVRNAIQRSRGKLRTAEVMTDLADQFGRTTGSTRALRTALNELKDGTHVQYDTSTHEPHARSAVLVSAVFEAFFTIYQRKTTELILLATNGSGILPDGHLPATLELLLVKETKRLATQFLNICIRAIDYCPPVDVLFGDFLRAVITADYDLVPDDAWAYREAWIDAFRLHGIYPPNVPNLSEDALRWLPPEKQLRIDALSFGALKFDGDPARPASRDELARQANALAKLVCQQENLAVFGLTHAGHPDLNGDSVDTPCIESIRSLRRVGPDAQVSFDLVAEVTQKRYARTPQGVTFPMYGGATIILDAQGVIRYVIKKNILSRKRRERQQAYLSTSGSKYWLQTHQKLEPQLQLFQLMHAPDSDVTPRAPS